MPVIAATKCGGEFTRGRNIGVAVQDMTDLVRIFLPDAGQRQLRESLCGRCIKRWSNVLSADTDQWNQQDREKKSLHRARILCLGSTLCQSARLRRDEFAVANMYVLAARQNVIPVVACNHRRVHK